MNENNEARREATVDTGREASCAPAATERRLKVLLINPNTFAATTELMLRIALARRPVPASTA